MQHTSRRISGVFIACYNDKYQLLYDNVTDTSHTCMRLIITTINLSHCFSATGTNAKTARHKPMDTTACHPDLKDVSKTVDSTS